MYASSPTLHSPEPCHLPFGKLVYGYLEGAEHLVKRQLSDDKLRYIFIFQTIIYQVVSLYALIYEFSDFINHATIKALSKPVRDFLPAYLPVNAHPHHKRVMLRQQSLGLWIVQIVFLYFYSPNGSLRSVHISGVVHGSAIFGFKFIEHHRQLLKAFPLKFSPKSIILWYGRQGIAFQHSLNI